jgi:hypothetical protein
MTDRPSTVKFVFKWKGTSLADLEFALGLANKQISEGYLAGSNQNDDGAYSYRVTAEPRDRLTGEACP